MRLCGVPVSAFARVSGRVYLSVWIRRCANLVVQLCVLVRAESMEWCRGFVLHCCGSANVMEGVLLFFGQVVLYCGVARMKVFVGLE